MTEHIITVKGLEARVTLSHGVETHTASGIVFDEDANVVAEREPRRYSGYCDAEMAYHVAVQLLFSRRQIEIDDITPALKELGLSCQCED